MPHIMNTKSTRPKNKKRPTISLAEALAYLSDPSNDLFHESVREMILEPEPGLYEMSKKKETT